MKCIIIDDEPLAIKVISKHIEHITNLKLIGSFKTAMDGFNFLQTQEVDLIFLDIQMPQMTGLALLKSLRKKPFVILCTAYREYALDGFDLDVVDYLLKPISFNRFLQAVDKVFSRIDKKVNKVQGFSPASTVSSDPFVFVKSEKENIKINLRDILYVESLKNHIRIFTNRETIMTLKQISLMEDKLPPQHFIRVHRSFIVAIKKVDKFTSTTITIAGKTIPVGRLYKKVVLRRLEKNLL